MKKHKIMEKKKLFFSDQEIILNSIKFKNKSLSNDLRLNIINEEANSKFLIKLTVKIFSINSKTIKKNDIFFTLKGKKLMEINLFQRLLKEMQVYQ